MRIPVARIWIAIGAAAGAGQGLIDAVALGLVPLGILIGIQCSKAADAPTTIPMTITVAQIQALSAGLNALDNGSIDQCVPAKPGEKPADKPCPYTKSIPLLVAMGRNMVALQGPLLEFQNEQNSVRKEALADPKLATDQQRNMQFVSRLQDLLSTKATVYLTPISMEELDLGTPPAGNRLSATTLAQLAPIISGWTMTTTEPAQQRRPAVTVPRH